MKSMKILAVVHNVELDRFEVVKEIVHDDNRIDVLLHTFFAETLEWKAAEYAIDDIDTAIDIVLYEPHVPPIDVASMTPEEAREIHLPQIAVQKQVRVQFVKSQAQAQLAARGVEQKYIDNVTEDAYAVIRSSAPFDAEVIQVRKAQVAKMHAENATLRAERESRMQARLSGAERAAAARKQLFRQENMRREGDKRG